MNEVPTRTPNHLWVVGLLSLMWNAFGAFDYVMTQTGNAQYLASFSAEEVAYFRGLPVWMEAAWALGVWGAVAGSILLLARSRHAVTAFWVSLLGLAVATLWHLGMSDMPASLRKPAMVVMNVVIWAAAIALVVYSTKMLGKGVIR